MIMSCLKSMCRQSFLKRPNLTRKKALIGISCVCNYRWFLFISVRRAVKTARFLLTANPNLEVFFSGFNG